jgi:hypothetical protein
MCQTLSACCAPAASGAAQAPASEVSRKRRRSMPGWWGGSWKRSTGRQIRPDWGIETVFSSPKRLRSLSDGGRSR